MLKIFSLKYYKEIIAFKVLSETELANQFTDQY